MHKQSCHKQFSIEKFEILHVEANYDTSFAKSFPRDSGVVRPGASVNNEAKTRSKVVRMTEEATVRIKMF